MHNSNLFVRIVKVDEEKRLVYGRAADETVDKENEVFDYTSSKPNFLKWSSEIHADTGGKSFGNIRSMHGNVSAGVIKDIEFDDAEKAINIAAKITDNNEWSKVLEGNYTGFSIGGSYAKKWSSSEHGKMITRYTANPAEISIVDRPCNTTAKFFSVHKKDGSVVEVAFKSEQPRAGGKYSSNFAAMPANQHDDMAAAHRERVANCDHDEDSDCAQCAAHTTAAKAHKKAATAMRGGSNDASDLSHAAVRATKVANGACVDSSQRVPMGKAFAPPTGATTGLQSYELEGAQPKKKPKKAALPEGEADTVEAENVDEPDTEDGPKSSAKVDSNTIGDISMADQIAKDAITAEGKKRGTTVTDGDGGGSESNNAKQGEPPAGGHGADRGFGSKRAKKVKDEDEDEDEDDDDGDGDDDNCEPKKSQKSFMSEIRKAIADGLKEGFAEVAKVQAATMSKADNSHKAPAIFAVDKSGKTAKADSNSGEVTKVNARPLQGEVDKADVATLIKGCLAQRPINPAELYK